jgi:hypothetical protein
MIAFIRDKYRARALCLCLMEPNWLSVSLQMYLPLNKMCDYWLEFVRNPVVMTAICKEVVWHRCFLLQVHGMQVHCKRKLYMILFYAALQPILIWWVSTLLSLQFFCLRPSAKDQGITWVVVVLVVVHLLVQFLISVYLKHYMALRAFFEVKGKLKTSPALGLEPMFSWSGVLHYINWAMVTLIHLWKKIIPIKIQK